MGDVALTTDAVAVHVGERFPARRAVEHERHVVDCGAQQPADEALGPPLDHLPRAKNAPVATVADNAILKRSLRKSASPSRAAGGRRHG